MRKQTIIDQIEITRNGTIQLRFAKEIVDEDGVILSSEWHRTALPPGADLATQMEAVNAHLTELRANPVDASEIARVAALVPIVHTKKVRDDYAAKVKVAAEKRDRDAAAAVVS